MTLPVHLLCQFWNNSGIAILLSRICEFPVKSYNFEKLRILVKVNHEVGRPHLETFAIIMP
jgi:hypothetical protein